MSQAYSDPDRAHDPHSLPDVETFQANYVYCAECHSLIYADHFTDANGRLCGRCECGHTQELTDSPATN